MTTYAVHDETGGLLSIGTVLADPLPDGLTAVALSDDDAAVLATQGGSWDPSTLAVVFVAPEPPPPDPVDELRAQVEAQQATIDALLEALGGGQ